MKIPDYYKTFTKEQLIAMRLRCVISGCQYDFPGIDKKPRERCVWCGEKRPSKGFPLADAVVKFGKNIYEK